MKMRLLLVQNQGRTGCCFGRSVHTTAPRERGDDADLLPSLQVCKLLSALGSLFPTRQSPSGPVIQPYHKSILDWFQCIEGMDSKDFRTDPSLGHMLLAAAGEKCCAEFELGRASPSDSSSKQDSSAAPAVADDVATSREPPDGTASSQQQPLNRYALRHTVAHLCLAVQGQQQPAAALLERQLLNIGLWQVSGGGIGRSIGPLLALKPSNCLPAAAASVLVQDGPLGVSRPSRVRHQEQPRGQGCRPVAAPLRLLPREVSAVSDYVNGVHGTVLCAQGSS